MDALTTTIATVATVATTGGVAVKLLDKLSDATGVILEPWKIRRNAKAEADATIEGAKASAIAEIIKTENQIEISELQRRTAQRLLLEEVKKQENLEDIMDKTIPLLEEGSKPEEMNDDWLMNYVDKAKLVCDEEMKTLWAKILSGEANKTNSFSKRTVNALFSLDKRDAELFANLCSFIVKLNNDPQPFIFDTENQVYNNVGINFSNLSHLESIGLIHFSGIAGFAKEYPLQNDTDFPIWYFDEHFHAKIKSGNTQITTGRVLFTQTGQELSKLCESKKIEGFFEYLFKQFSENIAVETVKCDKNDVIN
jgi:Protein of unknown function (DUF2806)